MEPVKEVAEIEEKTPASDIKNSKQLDMKKKEAMFR